MSSLVSSSSRWAKSHFCSTVRQTSRSAGMRDLDLRLMRGCNPKGKQETAQRSTAEVTKDMLTKQTWLFGTFVVEVKGSLSCLGHDLWLIGCNDDLVVLKERR